MLSSSSVSQMILVLIYKVKHSISPFVSNIYAPLECSCSFISLFLSDENHDSGGNYYLTIKWLHAQDKETCLKRGLGKEFACFSQIIVIIFRKRMYIFCFVVLVTPFLFEILLNKITILYYLLFYSKSYHFRGWSKPPS